MSAPGTLKGTAYHEAGHAVMHVLEHIAFKHATIEPDEEAGSSGHVHGSASPKSFQPEWDNSVRTRLRVESLVRVDLAGQVAEQTFRGRRSWKQGSQHDLRHTVDMLCYLSADSEILDACLHLLFLQTRNILRHPWNWAKLEAVASALLKDKTLTAREVRRIMKEADEAWLKAQQVRRRQA